MRKCYSCKETKELQDFPKSAAKAKGRGYMCRLCANAKRKQEHRIKRGIPECNEEQLLADQNNCCAICNRHRDVFNKNFAIDHDHATGKVRGLLCWNCNIGIGHFKDSFELLLKAADYLRR